MGGIFNLDNASDLIGATLDTLKTGYGIYQDQRDYYRNKHVQEETWRREDSAIQRRVADATKAGINPYNAIGAGAGAGAGSVISNSHSNIPDMNPGSWLDFSIAKEKLKQEKDVSKIINNQMQDSYYDKKLKALMTDFLTGYDTSFIYDKDGRAIKKHSDSFVSADDWNNRVESSPYLQDFVNKLNASKYTTAMLGKENDWFTANQVLNAINTGANTVGVFTGAGSNIFGAYRDYNVGQNFKFRAQEPVHRPIGFQFN